MIDRALITRKLTLIAKDLKAIERLARLSFEAYLADPQIEIVAERYLERIIGRMIDINYHLVTEQGQAPPADYFSSFVELGRLGVLKPDAARALAQAAGLRNRLVHEYDVIDERKVYEGLRQAVRDVPAYLRAITDRLGKPT